MQNRLKKKQANSRHTFGSRVCGTALVQLLSQCAGAEKDVENITGNNYTKELSPSLSKTQVSIQMALQYLNLISVLPVNLLSHCTAEGEAAALPLFLF